MKVISNTPFAKYGCEIEQKIENEAQIFYQNY